MKEEGITLGKYVLRRKKFLEEYYKYRFETMLVKGELYAHCKDVEDLANEMKDKLIKEEFRVSILNSHNNISILVHQIRNY